MGEALPVVTGEAVPAVTREAVPVVMEEAVPVLTGAAVIAEKLNEDIFFYFNHYNNNIKYHDLLLKLRRGSYVKSDNKHTIINIHPLAHILDICTLIFSSCVLFTVYPNRIM